MGVSEGEHSVALTTNRSWWLAFSSAKLPQKTGGRRSLTYSHRRNTAPVPVLLFVDREFVLCISL
jgi:hypothetical protein